MSFRRSGNPPRTSLAALIAGMMAMLSPALVSSAEDRGPGTGNRPMRARRSPVLTVGPEAGDLKGSDDKAIQAGVEYLHRMGGGTLRILPGVYELRNAIYLRPRVALIGSGEGTVLKKRPSVSTALSRDSDWYEYGVEVEDPTGFVAGGGILLRSSTGPGEWQLEVLRATITEVQGRVLFLDRLTRENFWTQKNATAATLFPLLTAEGVDDVRIEDLVLDGDREHNEKINGNFAGAVFIQECDRWQFRNVTARDYNGDGFSFQVCDDVRFEGCRAVNNADLGFHPGSGSQRPVFRDCAAMGNSQGIFFCWAVSDGLAESCVLSDNGLYGVSIGHRDTDNILRNCTIERNGEVGVLLRDEGSEFRGGHRTRIEGCAIRDNGTRQPGIGIDIRGATRDIEILDTRLDSTAGGPQEIGIRIGKQAGPVSLRNNTHGGCPTVVQDLRAGAERP